MFGSWTFWALWQLVTGAWSVAFMIGCGAAAVAVLMPPILARLVPDLRKWAIVVAVCAFSYTSVAGKFYHDGLTVKQAEWDAALGREADKGEAARESAVDTVRRQPPDSVRNDPRNRDNWRK